MAVLAAALLLGLPTFAWATTIAGSITGASGPLAGISVDVVSNTEASIAGHAVTAADGSYSISGINAGSYDVMFAARDYDATKDADYVSGDQEVTVGDETTLTVNKQLDLGGRITGTIFSGSSGISGAEVDIDDGDTYMNTDTSDPNGHYIFRGLPVGTYEVAASLSGYSPKTAVGLEVTSGGNTQCDIDLGPSLTLPVNRLQGKDRYRTAIAVSQHEYPNGAFSVTIASGANFPDALAAGPLANAYSGPVLLTPPIGLSDDVLNEIKRLAPDKVFIAGSGKSVSTKVESQLKSVQSHPSITRFAGVNRFDTAAQIADALKAKFGTLDRTIVVNGYGFADALSVGPLAANRGWPILLTTTNSLPSATSAAISRSGAKHTLVVGSDKAVSNAVFAKLPGALRKGGNDRYETCALVNDFAITQGSSYAHVAIAKGTNFPDALAAGPYVASYQGVLLLSYPDHLPQVISDRLTAQKSMVTNLDVLGSDSAVESTVVDQVQAALQ